jgi:hypothetical protein
MYFTHITDKQYRVATAIAYVYVKIVIQYTETRFPESRVFHIKPSSLTSHMVNLPHGYIPIVFLQLCTTRLDLYKLSLDFLSKKYFLNQPAKTRLFRSLRYLKSEAFVSHCKI